MARAYFSLLGDIAKTYTDASQKYIMPGVQMCNELSKACKIENAKDREMAQTNQRNELERYMDGVQENIQKLIRDV